MFHNGNEMKKIIILCDGTWQSLTTEHATNIRKLKNLLKPNDDNGTEQLAHYLSGVGTGDAFDKVAGGFTGKGLEEKIQEAYKHLCEDFCEGDEIHIIGFSRGAYTARSLVGFINRVGIINKSELSKLPGLWNDYKRKRIISEGEVPTIKSLTVFDTVGALGILKGSTKEIKKHQFHNVKISSNVEHIFHLLAVDERTPKFTPTLFKKNESPDLKLKDLKQVWFCGGHEDVGGGNKDHEDKGLENIALHWVVSELSRLGLKFDKEKMNEFKQNTNGKVHQVTLTDLKYRIKNSLLDWVLDKIQSNTRNQFKKQYPCQMFHKSVLERLNNEQCEDRPKNIGKDWANQLQKVAGRDDLYEISKLE